MPSLTKRSRCWRISRLRRLELITDIHTVVHLARRSFLTTAFSPGIYLAQSIIVLGACLVLINYRNAVLRDYVLILRNPFSSALTVASTLSAIHLAIASCAAMTREKEEGTMYVLFTGPVNAVSFVLGSFVAQILTNVLILTVLGTSFWLISLMTGFLLPPGIVASMAYVLIATSGMIALGVLVAAAVGKTRAAILVLLLFIFAVLILQGGDSLLYRPSFQGTDSQLLVVGRTFHTLNSIVKWVSPFSYLVDGLDALFIRRGTDVALNLVSSILFSTVSLVLAVRTVAAKGVLPS